jgi:hypothetical protein
MNFLQWLFQPIILWGIYATGVSLTFFILYYASENDMVEDYDSDTISDIAFASIFWPVIFLFVEIKELRFGWNRNTKFGKFGSKITDKIKSMLGWK